MYTVVAFSESQDPGGVEVAVAAVPDQHMRIYDDGIYIGQFNQLMGAYACAGASAELVRLISPSLRRINPYCVRPLELAITPAGNPVVDVDPARMIPLDVNEALECYLTSTPGGAEQASVAVFLADREISPVKGRIIPVHFQITLALLAGAWAFSIIDFIDELPSGAYKVVGAEFQVAAGVVGRFIPQGGVNRPGCPTVPDEDNDASQWFRNGKFGEWFSFETTNPPGVEILSSAAAGAATYDCYMDVIPV